VRQRGELACAGSNSAAPNAQGKAIYQAFDGPFYASEGLREDDIVICCGTCK